MADLKSCWFVVDLPALLKLRLSSREASVSAAVVRLISGLADKYGFGRTIVCGDCPSGQSFRKELLPGYRAKDLVRDEYTYQVMSAIELCRAAGLEYLHCSRHCAGDAIASVVAMNPEKTVIGSNRVLCRELLVDGRVTILTRMSDVSPEWITASSLADPVHQLGVRPDQVVDYFCLVGSGEDCVPGAKGIGTKRAVELLASHGSVPAVLADIASFKGAVRAGLEAFAPRYETLRQVWTLRSDAIDKAHAWQCQMEGDGDERSLVCRCPRHCEDPLVYSKLPGETTDRIVAWVASVIARSGWFDPERDSL